MTPAVLILAFAAVAVATAQTTPTSDNLIVPGVRVGPVTRDSTEASLLKSLGRQAEKAEVGLGEGMTEPGLVIYGGDITRSLSVRWNDEKPAHPSEVVMCESSEKVCRWHTASGIVYGTTLKDLERRNGRPFEMMVWGTDVGGNLISFKGGKLERELAGVAMTLITRIDAEGNYLPKLTREEFESVMGEKSLLSSSPVLQKLNPYIALIRMQFPDRPARR